MKIRDAQKGDEDAIKTLYEEFCKELGEIPDICPSITDGKVVVIDSMSGLIGYGIARSVVYGKRNYTQGEHIYVKPQFRKSKAGGFIYAALRRWAKKEQRPIILLSGVDEYEKWRKLGYKTLRYIMVKEIKCMKS
jgi:hypothetical protein